MGITREAEQWSHDHNSGCIPGMIQITLKLPFKNLITPFKNLIIGGEDEQEEVVEDAIEPKPVPPVFVA